MRTASVWPRASARDVRAKARDLRAKARTYTAALFAIAIPTIAHACPVCFGDPASPLTKGATNAVWFLMGVIGFVQIGLVALFVTFWRRARARNKFREQFHVIDGGVR